MGDGEAPPIELGIHGPMLVEPSRSLDQCWVLDLHSRGGARSPTGQLVYEGKHYGDKPGDRRSAQLLGDVLGWWYRQINAQPRHHIPIGLVTPVPSLRQREPHNLPTVLARRIGAALGAPVDDSLLYLRRRVPEMKTVPPEKRAAILRGAFGVDGRLSGGVLLVDDLLQSGATLEECAAELRRNGATAVVALCATRATKGMGAWAPRLPALAR